MRRAAAVVNGVPVAKAVEAVVSVAPAVPVVAVGNAVLAVPVVRLAADNAALAVPVAAANGARAVQAVVANAVPAQVLPVNGGLEPEVPANAVLARVVPASVDLELEVLANVVRAVRELAAQASAALAPVRALELPVSAAQVELLELRANAVQAEEAAVADNVRAVVADSAAGAQAEEGWVPGGRSRMTATPRKIVLNWKERSTRCFPEPCSASNWTMATWSWHTSPGRCASVSSS